ncbi:MAG: cell wall hydrolase [Butyrivibrio sp.]
MNFRSKKVAVIAVLVFLVAVQLVFTGMKSGEQSRMKSASEAETQNTAQLDENLLCAQDSDTAVTKEEVVSANLNVVYRSTLTSTKSDVDFKDESSESDFDGKIVSYTNERLCVYSEPDLASTVVGVMYSGTVADIVETGDEWSKITSGEVEGYVRNTDVLFGNEAQIIAEMIGAKTATIIADEVSVYSEKSASSTAISTLYQGADISVNECDGNWLLISCDNGFGYVSKDCVEISYGLENAVTIEEEAARQAEEEAARRKKAAEEAAARAAAAAQEKYASVETTSRDAYNASYDDAHLLAAIVYWESGWEPAEGQLAVANVVLNRVYSSRFAQNTIAGVIYAPGQFTGVAENGAPSARFQAVLDMSDEQLNARGCYDAAVAALSGQNNIGDLLFFISVRKANYAKYTKYTVINNHCFYTY